MEVSVAPTGRVNLEKRRALNPRIWWGPSPRTSIVASGRVRRANRPDTW